MLIWIIVAVAYIIIGFFFSCFWFVPLIGLIEHTNPATDSNFWKKGGHTGLIVIFFWFPIILLLFIRDLTTSIGALLRKIALRLNK